LSTVLSPVAPGRWSPRYPPISYLDTLDPDAVLRTE
jgi:hypothetical protein